MFDWGSRAEQTQVLNAVGQLSEVTTVDASTMLSENVLGTLVATVECPCSCWAPGHESVSVGDDKGELCDCCPVCKCWMCTKVPR